MLRRGLTFGLLMLLLLTACSEPPQRKLPQLEKPGLITVRIGWPNNAREEALMSALVQAFQDRHPGHRVEMVPFEWQAEKNRDIVRLNQEAKFDLLPDQLLGGGTPPYTEALDPFVAQGGLDLAPLEKVAPWLRKEGQLYVLPAWTIPFTLLGNRDLFEAKGVHWPEQGWTWEEFREAAARLSNGQGDDRQLALDFELEDLVRLWLLAQLDGDLTQVRAKELHEALQFFATMAHTDRSAPRSAEQVDRRIKTSEPSRFLRGEAAIAMTGTLGLSSLPFEQKFRWEILPMPVHAGKQAFTFTIPYGFAVLGSSPYKEAAWEFLRFAAGPEGAVVVARAGAIPLYASEEARRVLAEQGQQPLGKAHLLNTRWAKWNGGQGAADSRAQFTVATAANRVLSGAQSVDEAVAWFEAQ